jgi:carboxyl-terminal processing protease
MRPGMAILLSTAMLALLLAFLFASRKHGFAAPAAADGQWDEVIEAFVRSKVAQTYVDELTEEQRNEAFYRAMDAYVDLDYYCDFIPPPEYQKLREETSGRYAGLGIRINAVDEGLHIVGVFPGGPASQAGIRVGDTITRANGEHLAGLDIDAVTSRLKGPPNQPVSIHYIRGPRPEQGPHVGEEREVIVKRAFITPKTVFTRRVGAEEEFLHLRLTDFSEETARIFDEIMDGLQEEQPCKGLVLDLRHNGGGVLTVATRIADRFLRKGRVIVRMEGRGVDASKNYPATDRKDKELDLPLVVLVDASSASASEVVAGAFQDHRRAVLVGVRTYGKFLVQTITEVPGREAALKLTTSRYYTPSGRSYQGPARGERPSNGERPEGAGLVPDVVLPLSDEESLDLAKFWDNEDGRAWGEPQRHEGVAADWVDPQLQRAIHLLDGQIVLQKIQRRSGARRRNG